MGHGLVPSLTVHVWWDGTEPTRKWLPSFRQKRVCTWREKSPAGTARCGVRRVRAWALEFGEVLSRQALSLSCSRCGGPACPSGWQRLPVSAIATWTEMRAHGSRPDRRGLWLLLPTEVLIEVLLPGRAWSASSYQGSQRRRGDLTRGESAAAAVQDESWPGEFVRTI